MRVTDDKLRSTLAELNIIADKDLALILKKYEDSNIGLSKILVNEGIINENDLAKVIADIVVLPYIQLDQQAIDVSILNTIPEIVAKKNRIVVFGKDREGLHIATSNLDNEQTVSFIEKKTGFPVKLYFTSDKDIDDALNGYTKDIKSAYQKILNENVASASKKTKDDLSIIKIVEVTITYAYKNKSSDIHIEPYENKSLIRFRIDGILHDIVDLPKSVHIQAVTRIKVLAKLRTDEHQTPQDGKISFKSEEGNIDIRVSVVPTTGGEKVVMRLLSERSRQYSLSDLGLSEEDNIKLASAYKKPHGMILSTGPTGSGKTTTLYAILKVLNRREVNIMTIEDPVEYEIEGISQIQVNEKAGLTFADGLRSLVRQDPDIMLVGEIRDHETAGISVNAAMTGHLVLSTLHTNDAGTSIPRLLDMGIEPFLVSSTLNVVVAQRLVRKICTKCRYSEELYMKDNIGGPLLSVAKYTKTDKIRTYKGKGCDVCHQTGYSGRIGIFEVMVIDDEIRKAIVDKKDSDIIQKIAVKNGMTTIFEDGINKMIKGLTTIDEVLRVTKE
ncbi:MAG: Type IV-A pilus assembly ATPase PilB [Candidatus Woesebacteria bacterium GW2011_GWC1_38_13]|uniref:Type IV-A pilus assembly ATPase PilB n=2 Tax=Candidatus Woeseibacteriota TaxID=1752722 RepID=A0A0G0IQR9_9BACT|nr:MAG: Type IV-A pilus assembly ATPase PilB [Candidatus Woesebacteria bacterium GW2011_GWD1_38_10]KKQ57042.1 MAG: Type IV-A pilus assembly ATPase PilB [Candidatus Woesebacteria bacterium GW2011_GWC1_38_13]